MDEPRQDPPEVPPQVEYYLRRDRPICPVHNIPMRQGKRVQGVCFYYCTESECRCAEKITLKTIRRLGP